MVYVGVSGVYDVSRVAPKVSIENGVCVGIGFEIDLVDGRNMYEFFNLKAKTNLSQNAIIAVSMELVKKAMVDKGVLSFGTNEISALEEILNGGNE